MLSLIGENTSSGALEQGNPLQNVVAAEAAAVVVVASINMDSEDSGE